MILFGWTWVDPVVTILISVYIMWHVKSEIGETIRILMLGAPLDLEPEQVAAAIEETEGVAEVHHMHLWSMQERQPALTAHLVIDIDAWQKAEEVRNSVRLTLLDRFGVGHATLELEQADRACVGSSRFGHQEE